MHLFALDLATSTGFCSGSGEKSPELGSVRMPDTGQEVGPFLDFFYRWLHLKLTELMQDIDGLEVKPGPFGIQPADASGLMVIMEAPVLPRAKIDDQGTLRQAPTSLATTRKLQGLAGVCEMVCYQRGVEIREVFVQTVKKELGGSGSSGKPDMMAAARRCGMEPKTFDEADAFGVWLVSVRHYARQFQHTWDQRLYGGRGLGV
jgi:hypothetical protein